MKRTGTPYALMREVDMSYEEAARRIRDELPSQGFGVLTEIDVRATLEMDLAGNEGLAEVAAEARARPETALDRVAAG